MTVHRNFACGFVIFVQHDALFLFAMPWRASRPVRFCWLVWEVAGYVASLSQPQSLAVGASAAIFALIGYAVHFGCDVCPSVTGLIRNPRFWYVSDRLPGAAH